MLHVFLFLQGLDWKRSSSCLGFSDDQTNPNECRGQQSGFLFLFTGIEIDCNIFSQMLQVCTC